MSRVLMVADGLWNGGAERQMALLASSLPEPWSASVIAMEDGPYRPVFEELGIPLRVTERRFRFDVTPALRMWRSASEIRPDVVHSWGWMSTLAMVPWCRAHGVPLVAGTIRRGDLPPRRARAYRLGMRLADAVVANSRAGLHAFGLTESERARVVRNGFEPARLALCDGGKRTPRDGNVTVAIMAARMVDAKDWRLLLAAARQLSADGGWRFPFAGDGPDRAELEREAAGLVAAGVVEFPPPGIEVLPAVASADVGVLLTDPAWHAEGCSNSIMEYMACGLPVIATDSGGNPELVVGGVSGLLVPPHEVEPLVAALRALRAEPACAAKMGAEGRQRIETEFTVGAMSAGFVSLYDDLIASSRKARP
jgi:glycosyltransferase involved in cell wall biosynthesis